MSSRDVAPVVALFQCPAIHCAAVRGAPRSKPGNDHVTIAVALELERALGGWVPPKLADAPRGRVHAHSV